MEKKAKTGLGGRWQGAIVGLGLLIPLGVAVGAYPDGTASARVPEPAPSGVPSGAISDACPLPLSTATPAQVPRFECPSVTTPDAPSDALQPYFIGLHNYGKAFDDRVEKYKREIAEFEEPAVSATS